MAQVLSNLAQLLDYCRTAWPSGQVRCSAHEFGRHGLRADILAARAADVLVGQHGSGMINGLFMRRGSSIVEVRMRATCWSVALKEAEGDMLPDVSHVAQLIHCAHAPRAHRSGRTALKVHGQTCTISNYSAQSERSSTSK